MEEQVAVKPQVGELIPGFSLKSIAGEIVSPWHFKEKMNLTLVFFDPRDSYDWGALATIEKRYCEFGEQNAEVLAIGRGSSEEIGLCAHDLRLPFPVLADWGKQAHRAYNVTTSSLFVADLYGELLMRADLLNDLDATLDKVLTRIGLVELACPECGVSTWE